MRSICCLAAASDLPPCVHHKSLKFELSECGHDTVWKIQKGEREQIFTSVISPQAAQQIIELQEAAQINAGLQPANLGRNTSLHDMKTVVKTWRNRLPIVSDDLSHWSSIFMWRQHHYQGMTHTLTDPVLPVTFDTSDTETHIYDFLHIVHVLQGVTLMQTHSQIAA